MSRPRRVPTAEPEPRQAPLRQAQNNRSLSRGLQLLRAFKPGVATLTNSELAESAGLPRSTVSRLTQTLVEERFLEYVAELGAYRLGTPVLSLGLAMQQGSELLRMALPLMRLTAEGRKVNVGIACCDGTDMVYLASVRRSRSELFRHVEAGSRIPVALTSLGRAYLSTLARPDFNRLAVELRQRHPVRWKERRLEIELAMQGCRDLGYCLATWQPGIVSVAAPLRLAGHPVMACNVSCKIPGDGVPSVLAELLSTLREFVDSVSRAHRRGERSGA